MKMSETRSERPPWVHILIYRYGISVCPDHLSPTASNTSTLKSQKTDKDLLLYQKKQIEGISKWDTGELYSPSIGVVTINCQIHQYRYNLIFGIFSNLAPAHVAVYVTCLLSKSDIYCFRYR